MKKFFFSLFVLIVINFSAYSQNTEDSFALRINYIFQNVDKSQVPTGILSDYGIDFLNLDNYTGQTLVDSNYVGNKEWFALYNSIYSSQVRLITELPNPESVASLFNQNNLVNQPIGLAIMNYNYNAYREDAVNAGLVTVSNDQIYDVPGRTQSPYLNKTLFAITPVTNTTVAGNDLFVFKSTLVFANTSYNITTLEADKGNGYFSVNMNTPFSFGFTTSGIYNVKFRVTLSNGTQLISQTKIFVKPNQNGGSSQRYSVNPNPTLSTTINGSKPYLGTTGLCNVQVHLSTTNTTGQIRKPLIVVEGFDPWRIVFPDNPQENYNSRTFIRSVDEVFENSGFTYDFNEVLDVTGQYDLVFVDFDNGTDHIQRNAFVVDAVIRWVNSIKTTWNGVRQQNIIMGLSMGGLCTRYALRDMENNNVNHECRLFISHDVPHQGANVPIGIQMAAQHLGSTRVSAGLPGLYVFNIVPNLLNPFAQIRDLQALSESPAARQMLIQRVIYNRYSNVNGMFIISKTEHQNFQNEINQLGWPGNSRNISISNAACNANLLFPDNSQLFSFTGQRTSTYFGQLWQSLAATLAGIYSNLGTFWEYPLSFVSTKTSLNVDIWSKAVPPNFQNAQIYNGDIFIKRKILWLINIKTYLTKSKGYSGSSAYPLDNSPAGVYDLNQFGFDQNAIQGQLPDFFQGFVNVSINQSSFSFVPKSSSLNMNNPYNNLRTDICNRKLVCEGNTNFNGYYVAAGNNELHISYNRQNAEYIFSQMENQFDCSSYCTTIAGPETPCTNSLSTYSLTTPPFGGAIVNWIITPNDGTVILSNQPSGSSVDIDASNATRGIVYNLLANISGALCQSTFLKQFNIPIKTWSGSISGYYGWGNTVYTADLVEGDNNLYLYGTSAYEIWVEGTNAYPGTSYWEYISGDRATWGGAYTSYLGYDFSVLNGVDSYYNFTYTDNCGTHTIPYHFIGVYAYPPQQYRSTQPPAEKYKISVSPNPANNVANITVTEADSKIIGKTFDYNTPKIISVYNKMGVLIMQRKQIVPKSGLRLDISRLPLNDIYNVIIEDNKDGIRLRGKFIKQ